MLTPVNHQAISPQLPNESERDYLLFIKFAQCGSISELSDSKHTHLSNRQIQRIALKYNWKERFAIYRNNFNKVNTNVIVKSISQLIPNIAKSYFHLYENAIQNLEDLSKFKAGEFCQNLNKEGTYDGDYVRQYHRFTTTVLKQLKIMEKLEEKLKLLGVDFPNIQQQQANAEIDNITHFTEEEITLIDSQLECEEEAQVPSNETTQPQHTIHTIEDLITFEEKPITPISSWEKTEERKKFIDEDAEEIQAITRKIQKLKAQSKKAYKFDGHYSEHPALYKNPYHHELETV
jgi:hypothetical protein